MQTGFLLKPLFCRMLQFRKLMPLARLQVEPQLTTLAMLVFLAFLCTILKPLPNHVWVCLLEYDFAKQPPPHRRALGRMTNIPSKDLPRTRGCQQTTTKLCHPLCSLQASPKKAMLMFYLLAPAWRAGHTSTQRAPHGLSKEYT